MNTTYLILVSIAIAIFLVYNIVAICIFGMPSSLSDTFYLYQSKKKGLGYIFTAMMFTMALSLMPVWLSISDVMPGWEHNLTFLAFFAAAMICFVGAAPAFRNIGIENKVHMIAAKACAVFAIAWCAIVCWRIMYIIPIAIGLAWLIGWLLRNHTNANRVWTKCSDWIWEMAAFIATFATILTQGIILTI
jgi:hypothetical protein